MEILIKNFGPLDEIKFDLKKDLHLIYGHNAIGKSYATYCLYCLIKNITNKALNSNYLFFRNPKYREYDEYIKPKLKNLKTQKTIDCTVDFIELINNSMKEIILTNLQNSFSNTFSSIKNIKNRFSNKNYEIFISISNEETIHIFSDDEGELDLNYIGQIKKAEIINKSTISTKFSLYINGSKAFGKPTEELFHSEFIVFIYNKINEILRKLDFDIRDIYYLPASRSGLYQALNAFTPIVAELTQNRFFIQNKSIELPSLPEPLADYFIDLSTVDKRHLNKDFEEVISMLQNDILKGQVEYNDKTKRIVYRPTGIDLELNLSEASSMVSELSPLVLYFKHIINNKYTSTKSRDFHYYDPYYDKEMRRRRVRGYDILFIEEPEAHLHPEVQVQLMQIFAKISGLKLKIFITSHSNYMFNKLNNILIKNEINSKNVKVYHLVNKENGTIDNLDMNVTKDGIDDSNFQNVSEKLYFERLNFLEEND